MASLLFLILSMVSFKKSDLNYFSMTLAELAGLKWFKRVWDRIGVEPSRVNLEIFGNKNLLNSFLVEINLSENEFSEIVRWETQNQIEKEKKRKFWLRENLLAKRPIGKNWAFAYTVNLDRYAIDLSEYDPVQYRNAKLIGNQANSHRLCHQARNFPSGIS